MSCFNGPIFLPPVDPNGGTLWEGWLVDRHHRNLCANRDYPGQDSHGMLCSGTCVADKAILPSPFSRKLRPHSEGKDGDPLEPLALPTHLSWSQSLRPAMTRQS